MLSGNLSESAEVEHVIICIKSNDLDRVLCADLKVAYDVVVGCRVNDVFAINVHYVLDSVCYCGPGDIDLAAFLVVGVDVESHAAVRIGLRSLCVCRNNERAGEDEREHGYKREKLAE